jgi:hypothetical protein
MARLLDVITLSAQEGAAFPDRGKFVDGGQVTGPSVLISFFKLLTRRVSSPRLRSA